MHGPFCEVVATRCVHFSSEQKIKGVDRSYIRPFTIRIQQIKTLERLNQVIKQASGTESNNQVLILTL